MRKKSFIVLFAVCIGVIATSSLIFKNRVLHTKDFNTDESSQIQINPFLSYSCNESLNKSLKSYIDKVPDHVLSDIQSIGYQMELVEEAGADFQLIGVCGITDTKNKRILIQAKESKFRRSVVHEIFHAYDDYLSFISESSKFKEIYEIEKENFKVCDYHSTHYLSNVREYFAEACQEYIYHPDDLKANTPRTYEFVKGCINRVR